MVLNAADAPADPYLMTYNLKVSATATLESTLNTMLEIAGRAAGKIRFLIINCHGYYDAAPGSLVATGGFGLALGTGIYRHDLQKFRVLRGLVDNIWLTACGPARQTNTGAMGERLGGDGAMFCSEMAQAAQAYVVAATTVQIRPYDIPSFHIDDYEGVVLQFGPLGNIVWQHDYGRSWLDALRFGSN